MLTHANDGALGRLLGRAAVAVSCVRRIERMVSSVLVARLISQRHAKSKNRFDENF